MMNPPVFAASRRALLSAAALGALLCAAPARAQTDPPLTDYRAKVLLRNLSNPTSLAFRPDGRVYVTLKNGTVRLVNPANGDTSTAAGLPTANVREDGLHALVLDRAFATNRWVYVLMSERSAGDTAIVVARYATDSASGALLTGTRATLLKVPYTLNGTTAEHNTGTLAFGTDGNLFVALADNTQNIFSGTGAGYSPKDVTRPLYDAQRSAANTNDLRGKILRIRPQANGTYSIPAGNLFPVGTANTRPEIYAMGLRHPFRISVDPVTGWLYWAEPGPNASTESSTFGPRGYEEVNLAKTAGNYGWPYCVGNNFCYRQYDYASNIAGATYVPDSLRNTSPNNTGLVDLPPARPALVWYAYNNTQQAFPLFGSSSVNTGMIGPVYKYSHAGSPNRLPATFDRHIFLVEWVRNLIVVGRIDSVGNLQNLRTFRNARDSVTNGPMDVKFGPDGALYFLNWVNSASSTTAYSYPTNSGTGTLVRYEYTGVHTALSRGDEPRIPAAGGSLYVFGPGASFRIPAGRSVAEFYGLRGEKLWSFRRADASRAESVRLPADLRGTARVRVR